MATSLPCSGQDTDADSGNVSWLQRWGERHGINLLTLHGESTD